MLVLKDSYLKMKRAILVSKTTNSRTASLIMDHWIIPGRIPEYVLTDGESQFNIKFIELQCSFLGTEHPETTVHHRLMNGQARPFNKTIIARLNQYKAKNLRD